MEYTTLRDVIKQRDLTVRKLAILSQITPQDLYQAINGHRPFYPGWRKKVAEALQMSEEELFPEESTNEEDPHNSRMP